MSIDFMFVCSETPVSNQFSGNDMTHHMKTVSAARSVGIGFLLVVAGAMAAQAAEWFPLQVQSVASDGITRLVDYVPLTRASKKWSICVSFPHMKDPFFVAADYGIIEQAKQLGVRVQVLDAGGYTGLAKQVSQIEDCVAGGAQAVVVTAIAYDGLNDLLAELKKKNIPVIDAINGVSSKDVAAHVLTIPRAEAYRAGEYLAKKYPSGTKPVKVAWLPGPAGAGFVQAFDAGFHDAIKGSAVDVVETKNGDVGKEVQARLVEDLLQTHKDLDYLVGTAVMTEAAVPILQARNLQDKVKLVSVYMTPGTLQNLRSKRIEAAGATPVVLLGRVMLDSAVRALENKIEYRDVGLLGKTYTTSTIGTLDANTVLAPANFRPVFSLNK